MRLEQLKFLCAVVDHGFSFTRAAEMLHISQPAISKQINGLEAELGVDLLVRVRGRIVGLTAVGRMALEKARQVQLELNELAHLRRSVAGEATGGLVIATTHTHARYSLLNIIRSFRLDYPQVHLHLVQANPSQVIDAIIAGKANIGISSEVGGEGDRLRKLRGRDLGRSIIAPVGHPIFRNTSLTLALLSKVPLITLDVSFPGGQAIHRAFEAAGIEPNIVMSATDADVIKAYVRLGLGIAVLPSITFDPLIDQSLEAADATELFGSAPSVVLIQRDARVPAYMVDFINRVAPEQFLGA